MAAFADVVLLRCLVGTVVIPGLTWMIQGCLEWLYGSREPQTTQTKQAVSWQRWVFSHLYRLVPPVSRPLAWHRDQWRQLLQKQLPSRPRQHSDDVQADQVHPAYPPTTNLSHNMLDHTNDHDENLATPQMNVSIAQLEALFPRVEVLCVRRTIDLALFLTYGVLFPPLALVLALSVLLAQGWQGYQRERAQMIVQVCLQEIERQGKPLHQPNMDQHTNSSSSGGGADYKVRAFRKLHYFVWVLTRMYQRCW